MTEDTPGEPAASETRGTETASIKKYSRAERILVWGGILLLLAVVAIEYRARTGYAETVKAFSDASDEGDEEFPMHLAEGLMVMAPSRAHTAVNGIENTYAYTWLSLFRYGQFQINVVYTSGENPSLLRFWTGSGHDPMTPYMEGDPTEFSREELEEAMRNAMGQQVAVWVGNDEGEQVSSEPGADSDNSTDQTGAEPDSGDSNAGQDATDDSTSSSDDDSSASQNRIAP